MKIVLIKSAYIFQTLKLGLMTLVLFIVFFTSQNALGKEVSIGKINEIRQPVTIIKSNGQETEGTQGLSLFAGDRIITGKKGFVRFSFHGGAQFSLSGDAEVSVDELSDAEHEKNQPVLTLVMGYLQSKIQSLKGEDNKSVIHTPTTVIGVRGTEFDTVVSLDAATVVTVDDGSVEVDFEDEKTVVGKDRMIHLYPGKKPSSHEQAIPREKRDWLAWQKQRASRFLKILHKKIPHHRRRFERSANRLKISTAKINKALERIRKGMEKVKQSRRKRNRKEYARAINHLKAQVVLFKVMAANYRRTLNRVHVKSKLADCTRKHVANNKEQFSRKELDNIESHFETIAQKSEQLRTVSRETVRNIKRTFKELAGFR